MKALGGRILAVFCAALSAVPARSFDEFPIGARPAAMGGAFSALSDDVHALYYNPAGLGGLKNPEVTAYYAKLFPGVSDQTDTALTFMAAAYPFKGEKDRGVLAAGYTEFKLEDLFQERTLMVGYGRALGGDRPFLNKLSVGGALRALHRGFGEDGDTRNAFSGPANNRTGFSDPVFNGGRSRQSFGLDLGALYQYSKDLSFGLSLANLNRPDVGLTQEQKVPVVARTGASYKAPFMRLSLDLTRRHYLDHDTDHRLLFGGERTWLLGRYGDIALRGGGGVGNRDFRQISLGLGYGLNGMGVDYVFQIPLGSLENTGNTHQLSLSFRFGRAPAHDELADLVREEKEATARAEEALRVAEAEATFVKEDRMQLLSEVEKLREELKRARQGAPAASSPAPSARDRALREFTAAYQAAMRAYAKRVERGALLSERIGLLDDVIGKYQDKGVDVSRAEQEREKIKSDLAQAQTDFQITWEFYKKTVAQGADATERISLLERMIKKYEATGIDLVEVRRELDALKRTK